MENNLPEFHHIGHASRKISAARQFFGDLGYKQEGFSVEDRLLEVNVEFWVANNAPRIELIEPLTLDSTVWKIINKRSGPYHYAYLVDASYLDSALVKRNRLKPISDKLPALAFDGRNVQFFSTSDGTVIEFIEQFERH